MANRATFSSLVDVANEDGWEEHLRQGHTPVERRLHRRVPEFRRVVVQEQRTGYHRSQHDEQPEGKAERPETEAHLSLQPQGCLVPLLLLARLRRGRTPTRWAAVRAASSAVAAVAGGVTVTAVAATTQHGGGNCDRPGPPRRPRGGGAGRRHRLILLLLALSFTKPSAPLVTAGLRIATAADDARGSIAVAATVDEVVPSVQYSLIMEKVRTQSGNLNKN